MLRTFILCLTAFCCFSLSAQITISQSDMPDVGDAYYLSTPDSLGFDFAATGANFVWDASAYTAITQQTDTFIAFSAIPFAIRFQFPMGSNLAQYIATPDSLGPVALGESYRAFRVSATHYENLGLGGTVNGIPIALSNDPTDKEYFFPLTYGDQDSSMSVAELTIPGFFSIRQERKRINEVDGWGDLTTPYGTFATIRVRSEITGFDSLSFDTISTSFNLPTQTDYKWLGNGTGIPLMTVSTVQVDSLGGMEIVNRIQYQDSLRDFSTTSVEPRRMAQALQMYPNPSAGRIQIEWEALVGKEAQIEVWDLQGRKVHQQNLGGMEKVLDLGRLKTGTYLVRLKQGESWYTGKLRIVQE